MFAGIVRACLAVLVACMLLLGANPALAQSRGGTLVMVVQPEPPTLAAYLKVFEEEGALDKFEAFASLNGPAFYGLPANEERVTLRKKPQFVCDDVPVEKMGEIHPLFGGDQVDWSMA